MLKCIECGAIYEDAEDGVNCPECGAPGGKKYEHKEAQVVEGPAAELELDPETKSSMKDYLKKK
jgi:predicted  nucleic acid-binding Zn-ribbon protein